MVVMRVRDVCVVMVCVCVYMCVVMVCVCVCVCVVMVCAVEVMVFRVSPEQ